MLSPDRMDDHLRVRLEFEDWVDKQPRSKTYPWANINECACAQFIRHTYGPPPQSTPATLLGRFKRFWGGSQRVEHPEESLVWSQFNSVARIHPWTFGGLSDRLHDRK
jgi:hypothetical protein